jgi:hypothetical protein
MDNKYYNKYIKYKNKYILLKNEIKSLQIGGSTMPNIKFDTMRGQLLELIRTLKNTFIPQNASMFNSHQYFNEYNCTSLSISKINELKVEAYHLRNDPSYFAKMGMMDYAINNIQTFIDCIKTKIPHDRTILEIINSNSTQRFNYIHEIPVNMFEYLLVYLNNSGIDTTQTICSNLYQHQNNYGPQVPPNSNYPNGPYGQNSIAGTTNPYGPNGLSNPNSPNYQLSPNYPITTYVPKRNFSNDDDSSDDSSDEPIIKTSKYNSSNSVTIINIQTTKDKKITFTKNGDFVLKEGKSKDVEFELLIYVNNKKSYSIQSNVKKNKIINLFYNNTDKAKPEQIKNISIENGNNKIKINYNTKSLKELLKKLQKVIN